MRRLGWVVLLSLLAVGPLAAQEIDRSALDKLKASTCFVVVNGPRGRGSGSGVLFLKRGTVGYILTCEHVVRGAQTVGIVFGSGTSGERSFEGKVLGGDADRDLACVILKDAKDLPAPLDIGAKTALIETENVYVAGFPFGKMLAANQKNPEISISKVSVSSIRKDADGRVVLVQMSGDVNPGNSGGPVVDAKGKVIGITQAKLMGTSTAFAAPGEEIQSFLKGRVASATFTQALSTAANAKFDVKVGLIDPLATMKNIAVWWCPEKALAGAAPVAGKDGAWTKINPAMKSVTLKVDEELASGSFDVPRPAGEPAQMLIHYQVSWTAADGKTLWTGPTNLQVDYADAAAPSTPKGEPDKPAADPLPPVGKGVDIPVGDDVKVLAIRLLKAAIPELVLTPDGGTLLALDLSEGKIWALKPDTLEVTGQVDIMDNASDMCLTPDGRTLYVGGRDPNLQTPSGHVQVVSVSGLKVTATFAVPYPIHEIAATNSGTIAVTGVGQWGGLALIDGNKKSLLGTVHLVYGGGWLRMHPDQTRVYVGDVGLSPADFRFVNLKKDPKSNQYESYDSPYHGDHPLGGNFEITPDGRFLIGAVGSVLRLGRTKESDLQFAAKIDPGTAVGVAKGSNTFVVANKEGFLKVYDLQSFELKKSVRIGRYCSRVVLDPVKNRLFAVAYAVAPQGPTWQDARNLGAADIVSYSLTGK